MVLVPLLPASLASTVAIAAALGLWLPSGDLFGVFCPIMSFALARRFLAPRISDERLE